MPSLDELTPEQCMLLQFEVEQFFYAEAALLDERRHQDWLALLTEDIHYWMPIRRTTTKKEAHLEFTDADAVAFFDDDLAALKMRIEKLEAPGAWSEDPPSRTRHFITNVRILDVEGDEITASANFHLYRTRLDSEEDAWLGRREDVLRRVDGELRLARRHVFLEQTVILAQNMSNIF